MEEFYLLYFAAAGNPSTIFALAVLVRAVIICSVLPGAIVAVTGPRLPGVGTIRTELTG
jgi:hypothetical protein